MVVWLQPLWLWLRWWSSFLCLPGFHVALIIIIISFQWPSTTRFLTLKRYSLSPSWLESHDSHKMRFFRFRFVGVNEWDGSRFVEVCVKVLGDLNFSMTTNHLILLAKTPLGSDVLSRNTSSSSSPGHVWTGMVVEFSDSDGYHFLIDPPHQSERASKSMFHPCSPIGR